MEHAKTPRPGKRAVRESSLRRGLWIPPMDPALRRALKNPEFRRQYERNGGPSEKERRAYFKNEASTSLANGDAQGLLGLFSNEVGLEFVLKNAGLLRERGIYETSLLIAWSSTRTNWAHWSLDSLDLL